MSSKRFFAALILTFAFLAVLPLSGTFAASTVNDTPQPAPEVVGPNLLTNPGMEGHYVKQCSLRDGQPWVQVPCPANYNSEVSTVKQWETTQLPVGWSAWWQQPDTNFDDPNYFNNYPAFCPKWGSTPDGCRAWHNPEYRDTLGGPQETGPVRKVAGDNSQKYFTFYSVHEAGLYQVVGGVKPGDRLRFTAYQEGWSTGNNDPYKSDLGQRMNLQIGIDPTGGNNPWSPNIIWTAPAESFDTFTQFAVEAVARNNVVSVWTRSAPQMPLQHVDVYVDEASLNVVQPTAKAPARSTGVAIKPVATKVVTSTKIITFTRFATGADGIFSGVVMTQSVIVTRTVPVTTVSTKPVTTTGATESITSTTQSSTGTQPVTSTTSTRPVSGTLAIPASGTYTVVRGDTLIAIARRFGITPWWKLGEMNGLTEPYKIEVGQVLKLK